MQLRAIALVATLCLAGCSGLQSLRGEHPPAPVQPSSDALQATQVASYVSALQMLVQGSATEQAEVIASARAGYEQAKQGPAALRYALMLAAPGHPARDAPAAQRILREALARPELLNSLERGLAVVELQRMDSELRMSAENERLVAEAQRERQRAAPSNTALTRRLQTEADENARLRRELADARAKLDAIATIERNISATEGRKP